MFYCESCREENKYPFGPPINSRYIRCEICGHLRVCYDVPNELVKPTPKGVVQLKKTEKSA